ncbi:MerC domain-containing protein [Hymenobacter terrenus]|uniref:MerC domain-containing protein n=1 Tax=Hymenobacter terrenus TaxID=1629124 RepID=UPI0018CEDEF7|nr:MerC domain-containing protein [Hymenobacter terrenus]
MKKLPVAVFSGSLVAAPVTSPNHNIYTHEGLKAAVVTRSASEVSTEVQSVTEDIIPHFSPGKVSLLRRAADYGGVLNAVLCGIHCAAGPLLLTWWGTQNAGATAEHWELGFLVLSGVLVAVATWRQSAPRLRLALWLLFGLFTAAALLAEHWPWMQFVQYAASAGLIGAHLLNQRYCRRCVVGSPI